MATFGGRLKKLRQNRHLKGQEVATVLGVALSTYTSYENRNSQPPFEVLIKIAILFGVSLDYLVGRGEAPCEILSRAGFSVTHESNDTFTVTGEGKTNKCYQINANDMNNICKDILAMQDEVTRLAASRLLALASRK